VPADEHVAVPQARTPVDIAMPNPANDPSDADELARAEAAAPPEAELVPEPTPEKTVPRAKPRMYHPKGL
jgi:hypothetical protein